MADSKLKKEIERGSYKNCIRIKGAREHNLKGIDFRFGKVESCI